MRSAFALIVASILALPFQAVAEENPVVVELFTSQGCSACPPADALIGDLRHRDDVIALSLHVDYWDYIGWEDTFAQPAFTQRQYGYRRMVESTVVFTPQMVIGGVDHVGGYRPMSVAELIESHLAAPDTVSVRVTASDTGYRVSAQATMPPPRPRMEVHLVSYMPHERVDITRGENAGRVSDHYNVVYSWRVVADWDGMTPFDAQIVPQHDLPHVVLFQSEDHGAILGAARLN